MQDDDPAATRRLIDALAEAAGLSTGEPRFDEEAFSTALAECPEVSRTLVKVLRKEITAEEAKRRGEALCLQLIERYREIVSRKL